jgi:hypothetical protein
MEGSFQDIRITGLDTTKSHDVPSQLDFVQLRSIAERFREALQQGAWDFNQIGLLLGR